MATVLTFLVELSHPLSRQEKGKALCFLQTLFQQLGDPLQGLCFSNIKTLHIINLCLLLSSTCTHSFSDKAMGFVPKLPVLPGFSLMEKPHPSSALQHPPAGPTPSPALLPLQPSPLLVAVQGLAARALLSVPWAPCWDTPREETFWAPGSSARRTRLHPSPWLQACLQRTDLGSTGHLS